MDENYEDFLEHYASPYYDPVKAHEYYEAHKKLKGRFSTKGMTEEQRAQWKQARTTASEQKKASKTSTRESHKATVTAVRASAQASKQRIIDSLKQKLTAIAEQSERTKLQYSDKKVPKTASAEQKERMKRQNAIGRDKATRQATHDREKAKEDSQKKRQEISDKTKSLIETARNKMKEDLFKADYTHLKTLESEYEKVKPDENATTSKKSKSKKEE